MTIFYFVLKSSFYGFTFPSGFFTVTESLIAFVCEKSLGIYSAVLFNLSFGESTFCEQLVCQSEKLFSKLRSSDAVNDQIGRRVHHLEKTKHLIRLNLLKNPEIIFIGQFLNNFFPHTRRYVNLQELLDNSCFSSSC
jgi:hypothetical protein